MSKRDWRLFIVDISECIEKIEGYISGMTYDEYMKDSKTKDAIVRNLEIIGEAAKKIPDHIQERYKEIPWPQIVGMRNRLIHGYFVIDYDIVWNIVKDEMPDLKDKIKKIIEEVEGYEG